MPKVFGIAWIWMGVCSLSLAASFPSLEAELFAPGTNGTAGALVVQDGKIVFERYGSGYKADQRHIIWSASKNFTGALVGIAIERGYLGLDDSVCKFFPELSGSKSQDESKDKCSITVRHLLHWSSGLNWNEGYTPLKARWSSVIQMLYGNGHDNMAAYALEDHKLTAAPGTRFRYSSGDSNVLMAILKKTVPDYENFPWTALFEPLGITSAVWERDGTGTFVGSSYLYLTPRDMAKFGALYLNAGKAGTRQVLPSDWVRFSRTPAALNGATEPIGAQWWLNTETKVQQRPYPALPTDALLAQGHWGQYMVVVPSEKLVFVRLGDNRRGKTDLQRATTALMEDLRRQP